jgi:phage gp16-like protein
VGISAKKIQLIKVAQRKLGLDDATYRDALEAHAGVRSAKQLTDKGFRAVMAHFERCGFEVRSSFQDAADRPNRPDMATDKQLRKIYASWWSLGGAYYTPGNQRKALRKFMDKRFGVSHENFLTFDTAHKVIEAIKAIQVRVGAKRRA